MGLRLLSLEGTAWCFGATLFSNDQIQSNDFKYIPSLSLDSKDCYNHHILKLPELKQFIVSNILKFDTVCYSKGPGFLPCLKLIVFIARYLQIYHNKICYGANHGLSHIFHVLVLNNVKLDMFIALYVSGGNTILFKYSDSVFHIIGQTLDIAVGNLLDKFAISLNLNQPNGLAIQNLSKKSRANILCKINLKGLHFNLSGLINKITALDCLVETKCKTILYSLAVCLSEICERAGYMYNIKNIVIAGGVAQNLIIQGMLSKMCKYNKFKFYKINGNKNSDNSEMIGSFYIYNKARLSSNLLSQISSNRFLKYDI